MKEEDIFWNLCNRDTRYPMFEDLYGNEDAEDIPEPRKDCSCDNCFYGRDGLAMEILKLRGSAT